MILKQFFLDLDDSLLTEYQQKCATILENNILRRQAKNEKIDFFFYLKHSDLAKDSSKIGFHTPKSIENFIFIKKKVITLNVVYAQLQNNYADLTDLAVLTSMHDQFFKKENRGHRGVRMEESWISNEKKEIIYIPIPAKIVSEALRVFFSQINFLLKKEIDLIEIFYYAAYIHLVFVTIHPFEDGNGRTARLLEKWFLVQKLGQWAWNLPTEKMYWLHRQIYSQVLKTAHIKTGGIRKEGIMDFLLLLPQALQTLANEPNTYQKV